MTFPNNYNKQSGLTSGQAGKIKHSVFYSCYEISLKHRQKHMIINHLIKSVSIESDSLDWLITTGATGTTTVAAKFSDTLREHSYMTSDVRYFTT